MFLFVSQEKRNERKADKTSEHVVNHKAESHVHQRKLLSLEMSEIATVFDKIGMQEDQNHNDNLGQKPSEDDLFLADWIANTKLKQLSYENDQAESNRQWEDRYGHSSPQILQSTASFLPWERRRTFDQLQKNYERWKRSQEFTNFHSPGRKLMDTFADSLLHVHRIYNRKFGYMGRKVPAHMPHMIDVKIMEELQALLPEEFDKTSSHKLRSSDDMQFAFSYNYFVVGQKKCANVTEFFYELDADHSGLDEFVYI